MRDEEFEWDDRKTARNLHDHDVSFELTRAAFNDPTWIEDDDPDPHEARFNRICGYAGRLLLVTYTERADRIRIISARRANKHEQCTYFDRQS